MKARIEIAGLGANVEFMVEAHLPDYFQMVELKYKNVTGLNLTLTWDEEILEDFFKEKRKR